MKPGPELDEMIRQKIMFEVKEGLPIKWMDGNARYSTNIGDAWKIVEKMVSKMGYKNIGFSWYGPNFKPEHQYLTSEGYPLGTTCWYVEVTKDGRRKMVCAETAPLAICLAALEVA